MNAGDGEIVSREVGEEERGTGGCVDRRSDDATAVDLEINPQRHRLSRIQTNFALKAILCFCPPCMFIVTAIKSHKIHV